MKRYFGVKIIALAAIIFSALIYCELPSLAEDNISYETELLSALEITDTYFSSQEKVTRAELAECALRFINIHPDKMEFSASSPFLDVSPGSSVSSAAGLISGLNIMNGSDGFFYPNRNATLNEVITVMTRLLGHEGEAILQGGFPQGYYSFAVSSGMLDKINNSVEMEVTGADVCRILYNCLEIPVIDMRSYNENGGYIAVSEGTAMEKIFGVYKSNGIVEANYLTALDGESQLNENEIIAGGKIFNVGVTEASGLLGHYISFYYRYDKETDSDVLLTVNDSRNSLLKIDAEDITGFNQNTYWYYDENNKQRSIVVSAGADIIYNGKAIGVGFSKWQPQYGHVLLIDRDGDTKYDCIQITSYRIVVVSGVDKEENLIYDKCDTKNPIELGVNKTIKISDQNGYMTDFSAISANNVIAVAESEDRSILQMIVCSEKITGEAEQIATSDETTEITINSLPYKLTKDYGKTGAPEICTSDKGTFYLYNNYIAYFEPEVSSDYKFGYIISKSKSQEDDWRYYFRMLTQDNGVAVFELSDKIVIDEVSARTEKKFDDIAEQQLIRYILNAEGKIKKIDFAPEYKDEFRDINDREGLWQENDLKQSLKYRSEGKSFEGRFKISDSTLVFAIPETNIDDYDEYLVGGTNLLTDDKAHKVTAYSVSPQSEYCEALIAYGVAAKNITTNTPVMLVESVLLSINEDDDVTYKINGLFNGNQTSFLTEDTDVLDSLSKPIGAGDIIRFGRDSNNIIKEVKLYFDYSEQTLTDEVNVPYYTSGARFIYKNVYRRNGNTLFVTSEPVDKSNMKSSDMERVPSTTVYVYEDEKVRTGSINDVRSYEEYGEEYSKIVYFTVYGLPRTLVIYR